MDLRGQELARLPGLCPAPPPSLPELAHVCSNGNMTCGFQAAGLEFGVPFSPLLLPRMSTELKKCLPGSRTRSCKPGGAQGSQCGPTLLPSSSAQLTQGRQHPKGTKGCGQCSGPSAWTAGQCTTTARLTLSSRTAAMQRVLSSASGLSLCIYPVLLYRCVVTHMALWSTAQRWLPPSKVFSTSVVVMHAEEQLHQPQPRASFTTPSY